MSARMTPVELAEIKARADAATPLPWVLDDRYPGRVYSDDATGSIIGKFTDLHFVSRSPVREAAITRAEKT